MVYTQVYRQTNGVHTSIQTNKWCTHKYTDKQTSNFVIVSVVDCEILDATCSESLSSVTATWQPFYDEESGITG